MSRHPFAVPVVTLPVLVLLSLGVWLVTRSTTPVRTDAYVVIISHDHQKQTVPSREPTVGALLRTLSIPINQGDVVEPSLTTPIRQDDFRINVYRAVPVEVVDGGQRTFAFSAAATARSMAAQAGVVIYPEDELATRPTTDFITDPSLGQQVVVNRSTPVNVNLYGTPTIMRTRAKTVGELVAEKHIKIGKDDQLLPAADVTLTAQTQVQIVRNGTKIESVNEDIAMPTQTVYDSTLAFGTSAVRQKGSAGKQVTTYQDELKNNDIISRTVIQTVVTVAPVTQIVVQGTSLSGIKGDMALAGIAPGDYDYVDYIISHESGWCPTKAQGQYGACPAFAGSVPSTGGYGLCQSTPGSKMATAGDDWQTNPITQLKWCNGYAVGHYGSWGAAYGHWLSYHWW